MGRGGDLERGINSTRSGWDDVSFGKLRVT